MNIINMTEVSLVSIGRAALDTELSMDEILDRFTLALARRIAREDHEQAMTDQTSKKD